MAENESWNILVAIAIAFSCGCQLVTKPFRNSSSHTTSRVLCYRESCDFSLVDFWSSQSFLFFLPSSPPMKRHSDCSAPFCPLLIGHTHLLIHPTPAVHLWTVSNQKLYWEQTETSFMLWAAGWCSSYWSADFKSVFSLEINAVTAETELTC